MIRFNTVVKNKRKRKKRTWLRMLLRTLLCIFTALTLAAGGILGAVYVLVCGPSERARDIFVVSVTETSAVKFLAGIFLAEEQVSAILAANSLKEVETFADASLINIPTPEAVEAMATGEISDVDPDGDGLDIFDVYGSTYKGKMMVVYDPSRVFVGISGSFGPGEHGKILMDLYNSYDNVIAAINGGGWDDRVGHGTGGEPYGIVMSEGQYLWGNYSTWDCFCLTEDNKLLVGKLSGNDVTEQKGRDAAFFGPTLIINGEPLEAEKDNGDIGGLNPRTAIGQRADGAVLLLTVDGRLSNSLGASLTDLQEIMLDYGAINAYNLDGGSSTSMIYKGEYINQNSSLVGFRKMSTAIMVRGG